MNQIRINFVRDFSDFANRGEIAEFSEFAARDDVCWNVFVALTTVADEMQFMAQRFLRIQPSCEMRGKRPAEM